MKLTPMAEVDTAPQLAMPSPYPYGLRLNLTMEQLEALGYVDLPEAGTCVRIEALGCVTRACTEDPDADGDVDYACVEIQITELALDEEEPSTGDDDDDDGSDRAERMYGKRGG